MFLKNPGKRGLFNNVSGLEIFNTHESPLILAH